MMKIRDVSRRCPGLANPRGVSAAGRLRGGRAAAGEWRDEAGNEVWIALCRTSEEKTTTSLKKQTIADKKKSRSRNRSILQRRVR